MQKVRITNSKDKLTANFTMTEFWAVRYGGHVDFDCPKCLIDAVQILRDWYGSPILITSTIRNYQKQGYHTNGNAIDCIPLKDSIDRFRKESYNHKSSDLIKKLRAAGVEGFGIESGCIHLDYRGGKNCASVDEFGRYIVFEWSPKTGSKVIY